MDTVKDDACVTVVVTPREQFGVTKEALAALIENTAGPYRLIYVDGGSPRRISEWLRGEANRHGFRLLRSDRFLSPNEARNMGWRCATTRYVAFIDNDVVPANGWLEALIAAADETGADIVTPLICEGSPAHTLVHTAGGIFTTDLDQFYAAHAGLRVLEERMHFAGKPVDRVPPGRVDTQLCEFHCILVRRDLIDRLGPLDEEMLATREHLDFCMGVLKAGGRVVFEPKSVVTFLLPRSRPLHLRDWPYFLVRWSVDWQRRSIERFQAKWGLDPAQPCFRNLERWYRFRYDQDILVPLLKHFPPARNSTRVRWWGKRIMRPLLQLLGARLTVSVDRKRALENGMQAAPVNAHHIDARTALWQDGSAIVAH